MYEDGSMENPFAGHQQKRPFGGDPRQVFGRGQPSNAKEMRPAAGPQPAPTAEPVARFNDALPKAKQRQTKSLPKRQNAQQAVQQITRQAAATQPQRQFSAPAPTFTNAPASRSAAQNSLANTLNLMRSLSRR